MRKMSNEFMCLLNEHIKNGLIIANRHKEYPLTVYCYTNKTVYHDLWDEVTLMTRGLVLDDEGNVVAKPFKKFFNLSENKITKNILGLSYRIHEKMDGSLGICFCYDNKWMVCTKIRFDSDQAVWGNNYLDHNKIITNNLCEGYTYLFEMIYPQNKWGLVVDYGSEERFCFLGYVDNKTFEEFLPNELDKIVFDTPKEFEGLTIWQLADMDTKNLEGFVLTFENGDKCKIKLKDYLRIAKMKKNINEKYVWDSMKNGKGLDDIFRDVDPDFHEWTTNVYENLLDKFMDLKTTYIKKYIETVRAILDLSGKKDDIDFLTSKSFKKMFYHYVESYGDKHLYLLLMNRLSKNDIYPLIFAKEMDENVLINILSDLSRGSSLADVYGMKEFWDVIKPK